MRYHEINEDVSRRGFLRGLGAAGLVGAAGYGAIKQKNSNWEIDTDSEPLQRGDRHHTANAKPATKPEPKFNQLSRLSDEDAKKHEQYLLKVAQKHLPHSQVAPFMAQCAHETFNFKDLTERGSMDYFRKKYDNPRSLKILGNRDFEDALNFLGRGYIHLTGRDNYTRIGQAIGVDLVNNPDLAAEPATAAKIAIYYWKNRVANKVKDPTNVKHVTAKVNGKRSLGLKDRIEKTKKYTRELVSPHPKKK